MSAEPMGARITGMEHKVRDIKTAVDRIANAHSGHQNVSSVTIDAGGVGLWIAATACIVCVLVCTGAILYAMDAKADVRAERMSREIMNKWTAQEVTAIRSYITTGKLAPMNPPPVESKETR
jgi:hypothetical protein